MKVLLVHNFYGSTAPSGENQVFEAEKAMLEGHGVTVDVFTRHSDEIRGAKVKEEGEGGQWTCSFLSRAQKLYGLIKGAVCTVANPFAAWALKKKIREFSPDVVHFHNTFPLISPLAIRTAKKSGAKVVMTLHNYRMVCAAGVPMRGNRVCDACFRKVKGVDVERKLCILPAICHRCYRGSLLATVPLALNIWLYRKCWMKWIDKFIVLSEFQKRIMIECGLPADKIVVKGNFVTIPKRTIDLSDNASSRSGMVFVGRLSDEKGLRTVIDAWRLLGTEAPNLTVVGGGDSRVTYEALAAGLTIRFVGKKTHEEVMDIFSRAQFIIQPSLCWETFGLTVVEAAACGTPAIVSDIGTLPELIKDGVTGVVFRAGDAEDLARVIRKMRNTPDWEKMSSAALAESKRYSESSNYSVLMGLYVALKEPEGSGG